MSAAYTLDSGSTVNNNLLLVTANNSGGIQTGINQSIGIFPTNSGVDLNIRSKNNTGGLFLASGTDGINLDSSMGSAGTLSQAGPINLISNAASGWTNNNTALTIATVGSNIASVLNLQSQGPMYLANTGGGTINLEAPGNNISIGSVNTGAVMIGNNSVPVILTGTVSTVGPLAVGGALSTTGNMSVGGNLTVTGTVFSNNSTITHTEAPFIALNTTPGNASADSGVYSQLSGSAIIANNGLTASETTSTTSTTPTQNKITLQSSSSAIVGSWVQLTAGALNAQYGQVTALVGSVATVETANSVPITGTTFTITMVGSVLTLTGTGSGSSTPTFNQQMTTGVKLLVGNEVYIVISVLTSNTASVSNIDDALQTTPFNTLTMIGNWAPITQSPMGGGWASSTSGSLTATGTTPANLVAGTSITLTDSAAVTYFAVVTDNSGTVITFTPSTGTNLIAGSAVVNAISPGTGITYSVLANLYVGSVYNMSTGVMRFEYSSSSSSYFVPPAGTTVPTGGLSNISANNASFAAVTNTTSTLSGATLESFSSGGTWSSGTYTAGTFTGGALNILSGGGLGMNGNMILQNSGSTGGSAGVGVVQLIQSNASSNQTAVSLTQTATTTPFMALSGKSTVSGSFTDFASNLIQSNGNTNNSMVLQSFAAIYITDYGTGGTPGVNKLNNGTYWFPLYQPLV